MECCLSSAFNFKHIHNLVAELISYHGNSIIIGGIVMKARADSIEMHGKKSNNDRAYFAAPCVISYPVVLDQHYATDMIAS